MKIEPFEPLNKKRKIGSIEFLETESGTIFLDLNRAKKISYELQKMGYQTKIIKNLNGDYITIYFSSLTPDVKIAIDLYTIYETSEQDEYGKVQGLTREEHIFLGKMFGIPNSEIKYFITDLEDDFNQK